MKTYLLSALWIILAVVFVLYGTVVGLARSGSSFFVIWILLGIFFAALFFCSLFHLWSKIPQLIRILFWVLFGIGLSVFLFVEAMVFSGFSSAGEDGCDYLIVLGAQVFENGPSIVLARRLDAAAEYLQRNPDTVCIVSGGQGKNEPFSEARGMADYLIAKGIPSERILLEDKSVNTIQNILYSMEYIEDKDAKIAVVTSNFHVFRGVSIAKKQGLKNVCGVAARSYPLFLPNNLFREFFGVMKDFLMGNL